MDNCSELERHYENAHYDYSQQYDTKQDVIFLYSPAYTTFASCECNNPQKGGQTLLTVIFNKETAPYLSELNTPYVLQRALCSMVSTRLVMPLFPLKLMVG